MAVAMLVNRTQLIFVEKFFMILPWSLTSLAGKTKAHDLSVHILDELKLYLSYIWKNNNRIKENKELFDIYT